MIYNICLVAYGRQAVQLQNKQPLSYFQFKRENYLWYIRDLFIIYTIIRALLLLLNTRKIIQHSRWCVFISFQLYLYTQNEFIFNFRKSPIHRPTNNAKTCCGCLRTHTIIQERFNNLYAMVLSSSFVCKKSTACQQEKRERTRLLLLVALFCTSCPFSIYIHGTLYICTLLFPPLILCTIITQHNIERDDGVGGFSVNVLTHK